MCLYLHSTTGMLVGRRKKFTQKHVFCVAYGWNEKRVEPAWLLMLSQSMRDPNWLEDVDFTMLRIIKVFIELTGDG